MLSNLAAEFHRAVELRRGQGKLVTMPPSCRNSSKLLSRSDRTSHQPGTISLSTLRCSCEFARHAEDYTNAAAARSGLRVLDDMVRLDRLGSEAFTRKLFRSYDRQ